jgi:hypothetical protein
MKPLSLSALILCMFYLAPCNARGQLLITQRQITLLEKAKRPNDLWPRGDGHIIVAEPGSPLTQKGYMEPGGSFSPSPGSFGLSIWVLDKDGTLVATSDNIPMDKIGQSYIYEKEHILPSVLTITPYYKCIWTYIAAGKWTMTVRDVNVREYHIAVILRSVGPAGGPLTSVIWDNQRLLLNHRWIINSSAAPDSVAIGNESTGELQKVILYREDVFSETGWAFARMVIPGSSFSIDIRDTKPQFKSALSYSKPVQDFDIQLPDERFEKSLQAQIANLMMGYIGQQTGPGEPVNYPLAWERDGAYSLVAMAKSGHLETAKQLSVYFAENDFFGGFGAEGDAPGSAINALTEVAFLVNDPAFYQWVWPHIKRKLAIIDEMMNAKADIYKNYIGPLAPHLENDIRRRQLICRSSEDGLIIGTMDLHFPVLYINAISYRGFVQAARLAGYFKETAFSDSCLMKAAALKLAWKNAFGKPKYDNERNFMISIWPSWMTDRNNDFYKGKLELKHQEEWGNEDVPKERPLWTYFLAAEAHQWLFVDRPDQTWKTLNYFWANQCAPGLYTYWEGNGEENSFRQWENYRGWLQPKYITPHYWTASEMLLLQLDMLVYVDESKEDYQIVVGSGIPASWLNQPMSVKNYRTKAGTVTWVYQNSNLYVTIVGAAKKFAVIPGINFINANIKLKVTYK